MIAALFFSVALLVTTAYFLLGSVPLLILKHDTPLDARFIRGFYNTYYLAAMSVAAAASVCYALAVRPAFAAGAAVIALLALILRQRTIPVMDSLRTAIAANDDGAVRRFRQLHVAAISINIAQLLVILWSITTLSL